ncbi:MAG: 4Fe-4S binding protein [Candidatus Diapherotrites archaeon]|nr:4Fe-4S binding protein [Candidatus Diapherotrites archaeon]
MAAEKNKKLKFTLGAVVEEPGSSIKYKTGGWRIFKPEIMQDKCIKCGTCWKTCPDSAIYQNEKGEFHVNYDYCKGCLICFNECPAKAIKKEVENK